MTQIPKAAFSRHVLPSGVVLVHEYHPHVSAVSLGLWVRAGTRDERDSEHGLSHCIEHMAFKGTRSRDARAIALALEGVGGDLNAFTDREYTCFHATVLADDVRLAVELLSELVLHPTFPPEELERERRVLLQELAMVDETPEEKLADEFFAAVWPDDTLGRSVLGTKKSIKAFDRPSLVRYHQKYYRPERLVFSVAGPVTFEQLKNLSEHYFAPAPGAKPVPAAVPRKKRKAPAYRSKRRYFSEDNEQTHLLVGYETTSFADPRRFDFLVLSFLLGGGMSSRLFQAVREAAGLAYSIDCDMATFSDTGLLTVSVATNPRALPRCLAVLRAELARVRDEDTKPEDLQHVKNQLRGTILLSADQMETRQESLGRNELVFGRYVPVEEVLAAIASVTPERLRAAAAACFQSERESVVALGPGAVKPTALKLF